MRSIKSMREKRGFWVFAVLAVFLAVFSACDTGSSRHPDGGIAIVTINGVPFTVNSKLLICALNEIVVSWDPNKNVVIDRVRLELTGQPNACGDCGFTEDTDYQTATIEEPFERDVGASPFAVNFKAEVPGNYEVRITVTADGTFTDFPPITVTISTDDNPCLQSFFDRGIDGGDVAGDEQGYAADAPPVDVPGEIVRITGYNISANPDEFFLIDDDTNEYPITELTHISGPDVNGLVTIDGRLSAGCGQLNDLGVRNDAKGYPHPITNPAIDESAQTLADVYTYTPVITQISPDLGTCEGSTPVTISGGGFLEGATATINGNPIAIDTLTCSQITGTTPAGCGENLTVEVTNPDGNGGDSFSADLFDYTPEVLAVTPDYGPEAGGTDITITGCGFLVGAAVEIYGNPTPPPPLSITEVVDCGTITATTPRGKDINPDGDIPVPVTVTNPSGYSDTEDLYIYRPRNINPEETNYTDVSLLGDYNWIAIAHRFAEEDLIETFTIDQLEDDVFITSVGSDFNPAFAPIAGGSATFNGDGTLDISAGADEFYVIDDGNPSLANVDVSAAEEGLFEVDTDGSVFMAIGDLFTGAIKSGALAPDGNSLFVASTIYQMGAMSQIYVFTREGEIEMGEEPEPVDLNGKTMGMVAFVHDYGSEFWWFYERFHTFQGVVTFGTTTFVLSALQHKIVEESPFDVDMWFVEPDDSSGRYSADTSGLFSIQFDPANHLFGEDLFDSDEVFGIFTVTDNPNPEDAQLFAGVNLAQPPAAPEPWDFLTTAAVPSPSGFGRSVLLLMVPLGPEESKDASSFADQLEDDIGWSQGLFGHGFEEEDFSVYLTFDSLVVYNPLEQYDGDVLWDIEQGLAISSFFWDPIDDGGGSVFSYAVNEPYNGNFTVFDGPYFEGFISEDDSVNASVELNESYFSGITLELEK